MTQEKIGKCHEGVWFSGRDGIYIGRKIIRFAREFGFEFTPGMEYPDAEGHWDLVEQAENHLNLHCVEPGYLFGFDEGDFCLWSEETWKERGE